MKNSINIEYIRDSEFSTIVFGENSGYPLRRENLNV